MDRQVLANILKHRVSNRSSRGHSSEDMASSSISQNCGCSTVEIDTIDAGTDHVADLSNCTGSNCTPSESNMDDYSADRVLELHLLKPVIQEHVDLIQLSWNVHNILMPQADIQKQITKEQQEVVFEMYRELCTHEHRAIEHAMAKARNNTSLKSLKRNKVDLWHREISFQGVPSLEFVLERNAQRTGAGAEAASKTEPKQPFVAGKDRSRYRKMDLGDFLKDTSLGSWADEMDETPDPPSSKSKHGLEAAEPAELPFIGFSSPNKSDDTNSAHYFTPHRQSSLGFGGHGEPLQSHRQPLADASTHQTSPSSTIESQKGYNSAVNSRDSTNSYQASSEQDNPKRPTLSRDRDQKEAFKDGVLFRTLKEDLDNKQQLAARKSVKSETLKAKPSALKFETSSPVQPGQCEASSVTGPAPSTLEVVKLVEAPRKTSTAAELKDGHPGGDGRMNVTDDSDDEYEEASVEAVDEGEANMIVRRLLEKYTTLFQSLDPPTKPGQSTSGSESISEQHRDRSERFRPGREEA